MPAGEFLMRGIGKLFFLLPAIALATALPAHGQDDSPSLGDFARQARQQKQKDAQAKDSQPKDSHLSEASTSGKAAPGKDVSAKNTPPKAPKRIITNDEIPEHIGPTSTLPAKPQTPVTPYQPTNYGDDRVPAEYWKDQIQQMKDSIADLEDQIKDLSGSIPFAGANCVSNCVASKQAQMEKQQQLRTMKTQLEQQQRSLEQTQEMVRRQGYSSSVYDP